MLRTGNPAMKPGVFAAPSRWDDLDAAATKPATMTYQGTVTASAVLLGVCIGTAMITWMVAPSGGAVFLTAIGAAIVGLILCIVICIKPSRARILSIPYAICQGVFVGGISLIYASWMGSLTADATASTSISTLASAGSYIIVQATALTFGVAAAMLIAYASRLIRVTPAMVKGIFAATAGVCFLMMATFFLRFFLPIPYMWDMGPLGIGISAVIVVIAAFNLLADFYLIEEGVKNQAPKHMEWFGAFGLLVTLVWLYISILRLLALLQSRD